LWELSQSHDRIQDASEELDFFLPCEQFTDLDRHYSVKFTKALKDEALRLREAPTKVLEQMGEDHDDGAFRINFRAVRDGKRHS
jgi:hypothetical protein